MIQWQQSSPRIRILDDTTDVSSILPLRLYGSERGVVSHIPMSPVRLMYVTGVLHWAWSLQEQRDLTGY